MHNSPNTTVRIVIANKLANFHGLHHGQAFATWASAKVQNRLTTLEIQHDHWQERSSIQAIVIECTAMIPLGSLKMVWRACKNKNKAVRDSCCRRLTA